MSLLNDMLRDLSQQQKHYQTNASADTVALQDLAVGNMAASPSAEQQLFQSSSVAKKSSVVWMPGALVFIVVLTLLLIGKEVFFVADQQQNQSIISEAAVAIKADTQSLSPEIDVQPLQSVELDSLQELSSSTTKRESPQQESFEQKLSQQEVSEDSMPIVPVVAEAMVATITEAQQLQIYDLLQEAARALTLDRLTTPAHDNAHRYFLQILTIDPQNPAALQGLTKIAERYLAMADEKLQQLDADHAERLVDRAETVAPNHAQLHIYREKITQVRAQPELVATDNMEPLVVSDNPVAATDDGLLITQNLVSQGTPAENLPEPSVSIQEPFANSNEPQHLSIAPNAKWQDQQSVQEARLLIDKNNLSGAIQVLRAAIENSDKPSASTKMLLDIYCQQQLAEEVKTLLDSAHYLTATEQAYYGAKLALLNNEQDTAINLLEAQHTNAEDYEQYRALLASLYHSSARYSEAASHYRRLLNAFGDKPVYWLGFALALDALEQKSSALQAYKRLAEFRDLQNEVRSYIEQRVLELTP